MYNVTAPLIQVATKTGAAVQVTKGGPVPSDITPEALANLIDLGFVEKVKGSDKSEAKTEDPPTTAKGILEAVGDDKAKAQAALDEENAQETPRKGLVADLQKVLDA